MGVPMVLNRNKLISYDVRIDGYTIPAFIDTGASCAFMDHSVYVALRKFSPTVAKLGLRPAKVAYVQCANGGQQRVLGEFTAKMRVGPLTLKGDLIVVNKQPIPLLLGGDVLLQNGVSIDYLRRVVFAQSQAETTGPVVNTHVKTRATSRRTQPSAKFLPPIAETIQSTAKIQPAARQTLPAVETMKKKLQSTDNSTVKIQPAARQKLPAVEKTKRWARKATPFSMTAVHAQNSYVVPAESQHIIWCKTPNQDTMAPDSVLVEPDEAMLQSYGLIATATVSHIVKGRVPLQLLILSPKPVTIVQGQRLAHYSTFSEASAFVQQAGTAQAARMRPKLARDAKLSKVLSELKFSEALKGFPSEKQKVRDLIDRHLDVFAEDDEDIGLVQNIQHHILLPHLAN